jgi:integrase
MATTQLRLVAPLSVNRTVKLYVTRAKSGSPSTHPLARIELRALHKLRRESPKLPFVFVSARSSPFTTAGSRKMVARLGEASGFEFGVHPHMLRHGTGYKLANQGVDTRSLQHYFAGAVLAWGSASIGCPPATVAARASPGVGEACLSE